MSKFNPGQIVWVPASRISMDHPWALIEATVVSQQKRTIVVELANGNRYSISSMFIHKDVGIAIVRIGDFISEVTLLDPLYKSLTQYCRLLLRDDFIRVFQVRTLPELSFLLENYLNAFRYIILIGHGRKDSICFGNQLDADNWITAGTITKFFNPGITSPKIILSCCCRTGRSDFAKHFSDHTLIESYIGPHNEVHGADASSFVQLFLAKSLLDGNTIKTAFNLSETAIGVRRDFRLWRKGKLDSK